MLLRVGVISLSFSLLLALVVAAVFLLQRPEETAVTEPIAAKSESSEPRNYVDREIPIRESADLPVESKPVRSSNPEPVAPPEPQPQSSLPVVEEEWPLPDSSEVEAANRPRRYNWIPGAIMTLTVNSMEIYNAPVMRTDNRQALENGVVHVPETSLPWTRAPQRNVYLAGHRLGWPGTGSRLIFYNLDQLTNGDTVLLRDRRGKRYRYKVTEKFVVNPNDRWVMGQVINRDMVTLQTCTGPNFGKRLIVRADRI